MANLSTRNIRFIRKRFEKLKKTMPKSIYILVVTETKLDFFWNICF